MWCFQHDSVALRFTVGLHLVQFVSPKSIVSGGEIKRRGETFFILFKMGESHFKMTLEAT